MSGQQQYYRDNVMTTIARLEARVATLEKALRRGSSPQLNGLLSADTAATLPGVALPPVADIADVPIVVRATGRIYRFEAVELGGHAKLRLVYVGQTRESS